VNSASSIQLSVALVTRNRPEQLRRALGSLAGQSVQPREVIVSDDSDAGNSLEVRAIAGEFGARYVEGPRQGLYANRNAAAVAVTGTHVRTMDDDHTLPAGHLAQCLAAMEKDPAAIWTCGEEGYLDDQRHAFLGRAIQLQASGVGAEVDNPDDNWGIADGATIYPREVFERGFRFAETFPFGSSYLEFGALLYRYGWRSRCIPDAYIEHRYDSATLTRTSPASVLYASLCYNLRFRPSRLRALRYLVPALLRTPRLVREVPGLIRLMGARWSR